MRVVARWRSEMDIARIRKSFLEVDTLYLDRISSELHKKVNDAVKQSGPDKAFEVDEFATLLLTPEIIEEAKRKFSFDAKIKAAR